jgi:hypothetical protein
MSDASIVWEGVSGWGAVPGKRIVGIACYRLSYFPA